MFLPPATNSSAECSAADSRVPTRVVARIPVELDVGLRLQRDVEVEREVAVRRAHERKRRVPVVHLTRQREDLAGKLLSLEVVRSRPLRTPFLGDVKREVRLRIGLRWRDEIRAAAGAANAGAVRITHGRESLPAAVIQQNVLLVRKAVRKWINGNDTRANWWPGALRAVRQAPLPPRAWRHAHLTRDLADRS